MIFRKSKLEDLNEILSILEEAKDYFRENNINQWTDGYPNEAVIKKDIEEGVSYVLEDKEEILATASIILGEEITYKNIYKGSWLSPKDSPYGVIHRMGVRKAFKGQGLAQLIFEKAEDLCIENNIYSMKVDTNPKNKSMQKALIKRNYHYCGLIHIRTGEEYFAYEKILD